MRILLVDDSNVTLVALAKFMVKLGYKKILQATSVTEALQLLASNNFNLIISDWNMPGGSGLDLLMKVRSYTRTANIPFIMITAVKERDKILQAVKVGIQGYLIKPINFDSLTEKIIDIAQQYGLEKPKIETSKADTDSTGDGIDNLEEKSDKETEDDQDLNQKMMFQSFDISKPFNEFKSGTMQEFSIWTNGKTSPLCIGFNIGRQICETILQSYDQRNFCIMYNESMTGFGKELVENLKHNLRGFMVPVSTRRPFLRDLEQCLAHFESSGIKQSNILVAIGDRELLEYAGFVSSIYRGGMESIWIPVDICGMLDSCFAPCASVNGNSMPAIGRIRYSPNMTLIDIHLLLDLLETSFSTQLGELLRCVFCGGREFGERILSTYNAIIKRETESLSNVILHACLVKIKNSSSIEGAIYSSFGNVILESLYRCFFSDQNIRYEQLIKPGLKISLEIAKRINSLTQQAREYYRSMFDLFPDPQLSSVNIDTIIEELDNGISNQNEFVLPSDIGELRAFPVSEIKSHIPGAVHTVFDK